MREGESGIQPLIVPHVLDKILSCLCVEDLKSCRLVCKQWEDCASKQMGHRSYLHFTLTQQIKDFLSREPDERGISGKLCRNICLFQEDIQDSCWLLVLEQLLRELGSNLKSFTLHPGFGDLTEDILKVLMEFENIRELHLLGTSSMFATKHYNLGNNLMCLSSVENLHLQIPESHWRNAREHFPELFDVLPNIRRLKLTGTKYYEVLHNMPNRFQWKLDSLTLEIFGSQCVHEIMLRCYSLTNLVLKVEPYISLNSLHEFIMSFATTLTTLEINFPFCGSYNYSHNATSFPSAEKLQSLKYLRLFGYWGPIDFLLLLTKLKSVYVERTSLHIAFPSYATTPITSQILKKVIFIDETGIKIDNNTIFEKIMKNNQQCST